MPLVVKKVDRYLIDYIGGPALQEGGAGAIVSCFAATGLEHDTVFHRVGTLAFFSDSKTTPPNQYLADGTISLYFEMSRFKDVADILRFSEPLQIAIDTETFHGYIGNAQTEDVGQQEGV